jgi:preprotein translocase subunit SecE
MAKNKQKPTKEAIEMEKSDEVLTVVDTKKAKKQNEAAGKAKNVDKKAKQKKKNNKADKQRRNWFKEIFSELKKVQWPTFGKACKQTGTVLVVVSIFMLAVLGIDSLVSLILNLIGKI